MAYRFFVIGIVRQNGWLKTRIGQWSKAIDPCKSTLILRLCGGALSSSKGETNCNSVCFFDFEDKSSFLPSGRMLAFA